MGVKQESADSALYAKVKEVDLRGEEMLMTVMRILIGVIQRTARRCVLGVEILNILLSFASQTCLMTSSTAFLNHSAHIATIDQDDHSNDDLFAFAVDRRPNRPTSLATAFSDLALTKFTLDSTNVNTATTTAQSVADSAIAAPRKKKKKTGGKKSESLEFTF